MEWIEKHTETDISETAGIERSWGNTGINRFSRAETLDRVIN